MSSKPTLEQVLFINPTQAEKEANRQGYIPESQRISVHRLTYNVRNNMERATGASIFGIIMVLTYCVFLFPESNDWRSWLTDLVILVFMVIVITIIWYERRKKYLPVQAALHKYAVFSVTGVPTVGFEEGRAYVEVDGVRLLARDKYAVGWKTDDVYTVFYMPDANIPLSCEKVIDNAELD